MKRIIKELKLSAKHELDQVGLTPRTDFDRSQEEHDEYHRKRAQEYLCAAKTLIKACQ